MTETHPKIRLCVDAALATGVSLTLPPAQAHYLTHVMRLRTGEAVALFNGRDGEWRATLAGIGRKDVSLTVDGLLRPQPDEPGPWLAFAPVKRAKTDLIVEKATELGVERILPVMTARAIAERVRLDRLETIAREAAEQCGRLTLPRIDPPAPLDRLLADWPASRVLVFCDTASGAPGSHSCEPAGNAGVLIGPEGGFTEAERRAILASTAACALSLGPLVLRAETAAIAALARLRAVT